MEQTNIEDIKVQLTERATKLVQHLKRLQRQYTEKFPKEYKEMLENIEEGLDILSQIK